MKAKEIQISDRLLNAVDGTEVYRVESVQRNRKIIRARVRFPDGGTDVRSWYPYDEVPLTRGSGS